MDRFEYEIRAKEIVSLYKQGEYAKAVKIVDTIDWRRVQGLTMLYRVSDIYRHTRRYEESRDILLMANEISPNTKRVVYALCELSIILEDPVKAVEYFEQYKQIAPHEVDRFILQYKIYESHDVSLEERIAVLEKYKMYNYDDPDPKWTYELAYLYHRIGLTTRCVEECDELILWFGDGEYVYKALELKMLHAPLTPTQQEKYNARFLEKREAIALAEEATAEESMDSDVQAPMNISVKNVAPTKAKTTRIPSLRMGWKNRAAALEPEEEDEDIRIADEKDRARYHRGYKPEPEPASYEEEEYEDEAEYGDDEVYEDENYPETEEDYEDEAYEEEDFEEDESEEYEDEEYEDEEYEDSEEEYEEEYETVEEDFEDEDYEEEEEDFEEDEEWEEEESPAAAEDSVKIAETKDLSKAIGAVVLPETEKEDQAEAKENEQAKDDDSDMRIVTPDVEDIKVRTIDAGNRFDTINLEEETSKYLAKEIVKLMEEDDMEAADATRALPMNSIFHDSIDSLQPHVISRAIEMAEEMNNERIARETGKIPQFGQGDTVEIEEVYSEESEEETKEPSKQEAAPARESAAEEAEEASEETEAEADAEPEEVEDDFVEISDDFEEIFEEEEEDEEAFFDDEDAEVEEDFEEDETADEDMRQITVDEDMTEITADEDMTELSAEEEDEEYPEEDPDDTFDPAMLFDDEYEEEDIEEIEEIEEEEDFEAAEEEAMEEEEEEAAAEPEEPAREMEKIEPIVFSQSKPLPKEFIEAVQIVAMEAAKEAAAAAAAAAASQVAAAAASQAAAAAATQVAQASQVQAAQVARQAAQEAAAATADAMKEMQPVVAEAPAAPAPAESEKPQETAPEEAEKPMVEKQITGQLSFRDIIAEWEDVKKATEQQQIEEIKQKVKEQSSPLLNNYDNVSAFEQNELNTISPMIDVFDGAEELEKEARSALQKEMENVSVKAEEELPEEAEEAVPEEKTEPESEEAEEVAEEEAEEVLEEAEELTEEEPEEEEEEPEQPVQAQPEKEASQQASNFNTAEINGLEDKLVSALAGQHYDTSNLQAEILHSILDEAESQEAKEEKDQTAETETKVETETAAEDTTETTKDTTEETTEAAAPAGLASSAAEAVAMAKAAQLAAQGAVEKAEPTETKSSEEEPKAEEASEKKEMDVDKLYAQLMEKKAAEAAGQEAPKTEQAAESAAASQAQSTDSSEEEDGEEARVLTKEERDLFSHVANGKQMQQRLARIIDQASLEPLASNIRVVGENGTDPETVGKELVAAIGLYAPSVSDKSVVLTAEELSGQNMDSFLAQYNDGSLVITEAGSMTADTVSTLFEKAGSLSGLLIVLCDTDDNMQRLTDANPKVEEYASQKLVVDVLDNDGLVTFAQAYAKEKEYSIDEMGKLALYNRIEERQRQDHAVTTAEVRGIVDSAIEKVEKKGIGRFVDVLLAKRYDKEDMIVLREKDFMLDK